MKKIYALLLLIAILAYLSFWPVPVEPVAWQAPKAPTLEKQYENNHKLASIKRLAVGEGVGPESIAIDADGYLYTGYVDGRIVRFDLNGKNPDLIVNTYGRPLGLKVANDGHLIVADALRGLLKINSQSGILEVLTNSADDLPFKFTDDLVIADDGNIYFTDASSKFGPAMHARDDIIEHGGHGRLLKYDPSTKVTSVLLDGLEFANGIALSQDQSFLVVAETGNYDIIRYWLTGPKADQHEMFFDNLPGIPDGMSSNGEGTFWVALYAPRNALLDFASPYPWLRKVFYRLPQFLQPQPAAHAFVLGLNEKAEVTHNLQDASVSAFHPVTSVIQHHNKLYLGSLTADHFSVYELETSSKEKVSELKQELEQELNQIQEQQQE